MDKGLRWDWGRAWGAVGLDGEAGAGQEGMVGDSGPNRQWLTDALKENDPSNVILFLVGSKKDLSVSLSPFPLGSLCPGSGEATPATHTPPGSVGRRRHSTA